MKKILCLMAFLQTLCLAVMAQRIEIVDAEDGQPLPAASIFNSEGHLLGVAGTDGSYEGARDADWPLTVRYIGYRAATVESPCAVIKMERENVALPEIEVGNTTEGVWLLCYARGCCSVSQSENVDMIYSEKMVDFLIPLKKGAKGFKKISKPRILLENNTVHTVTPQGRDTTYQASGRGIDFSLFSRDIDNVETEPDSMRGLDVAVLNVDDGDVGITYRKGGGHFSITKDHLFKDEDHRFNMPGIVNLLLGMKVSVTEDVESRLYGVNSYGKYYPSDLALMSMTIKMELSGKRIKKKTGRDEPADAFLWTEIYPVDYRFVTAAESKDIKENPPKVEMKRPAGLSE